MLYSIIPPIIVVLSLAGIIVFLAKKTKQVEKLEEEKSLLEKNEKNNSVDEAVIKDDLEKEDNGRKEKIKEKIYLETEKILKKFKIFFLKLENTFSHWIESLKNKRIEQEEKAEIQIENKTGEVAPKEEEVNFEKEPRGDIIVSSQKEIQRPSSEEKKDIFEKIMVERIATNPKDLEAYERLGEHYMDNENWNYAKECFKQVVKLSPGKKSIREKMRKLEKLLGKK